MFRTNAGFSVMQGLYAITPMGLPSSELLARVRAVLHGSVRWLQYRNKSADAALKQREAEALLSLCHEFQAHLIINDDVLLARRIGAYGVHLGRDDGELDLDIPLYWGASCYDSLAYAETAVQNGANYLAFGAMFASLTKPQAVKAPLHLLTQAQRFERPVVAIGGITLHNAPLLLQAGASALAVITDLFDASDIAQRAHAYQQLFCQPREFPKNE